MSPNNRRVAILITDFAGGGVSKMMVHLATGFSDFSSVTVDFIIKNIEHPYLEGLDPKVNAVVMKTDSPAILVESVAQYLSEKRPEVLMSAMLSDHELAINAKQKCQLSTRLFFCAGTNYVALLASDNIFKRWRHRRRIRSIYQKADEIICVSQGVAKSLINLCGLTPSMVHVLKTPTLTPQLLTKAEEPIDHPWFQSNPVPVILGVGNLSRNKNFALLIDAFAKVRAKRPCRLVIIGKGRQVKRLLRRAEKLKVHDDVALLGFIANPYPYMKKATLLVLTSKREGSPNVLVEAMAVGTPVVATDCPSGPREILDGGKYGRLVPMNDPDLLSNAIIETLDSVPNPRLLQKAVTPYLLRKVCTDHLKVFHIIVEHDDIQ